jgi:hypothetical protein
MLGMDKQSKTIGSRFPWGQVVGMMLVIGAGFYASQHPHSFFYYLIKFIVSPIP